MLSSFKGQLNRRRVHCAPFVALNNTFTWTVKKVKKKTNSKFKQEKFIKTDKIKRYLLTEKVINNVHMPEVVFSQILSHLVFG